MNLWKVGGLSSAALSVSALTAGTVVLGRSIPGLEQGSAMLSLGGLAIAITIGAVSWQRSPLAGLLAAIAAGAVIFGGMLGWIDWVWLFLSNAEGVSGLNGRWLVAILIGAAVAFTVDSSLSRERKK